MTAQTNAKMLVGGRYRQGTTIANLFTRMADGKPRTIAQLQGAATAKGVDLAYRIQRLRIHGRSLKAWTLVRDGKQFTMKVNKGRVAQLVAKSATAAPKVKKAAKKVAKKTTKRATAKRMATKKPQVVPVKVTPNVASAA